MRIETQILNLIYCSIKVIERLIILMMVIAIENHKILHICYYYTPIVTQKKNIKEKWY